MRSESWDRPLGVFRTRALGSVAELVVTDHRAIVPAAEMLRAEVERIDSVASRFRDDSELSRLNAAAGTEVRVSPDLLEAVQVALWAADVTDGAVDPTVGAALRSLGYDRDFAAIKGGLPGTLRSPGRVPGWQTVEVSPEKRTVRLPRDAELDLGATAKALAADSSAAAIHRALGCGVLVSLGGDISIAGPPPPGGFTVGLRDVSGGSSRGSDAVALGSGGLATSGVAARRWRLGGAEVHHVLDPSNGLPAPTCWRTVSVAALCCVHANAASTACLVKGRSAPEWLRSLNLPARLVAKDGSVQILEPWGCAEAEGVPE